MYNRQAQNLAQQGRYGDNMLVHMNPQEVAGLAALARAHGGHISINPKTGLPEAWGIGKIFGSKGVVGKVADAVGLGGIYSDISKGVSGALQGITKAIAPAAPLLGLIPGVGVPLAAIVGGMRDGKNWDPKRGIMSGLSAYGVNSLMYPELGTAASAAPITEAATAAEAASAVPGVSVTAIPPSGVASLPSVADVGGAMDIGGAADVMNRAATVTNTVPTTGIVDTLKSFLPSKETTQNIKDAAQLGTAGMTAYGGIKSYQETKAAKEAAAKILADQQAHTAQQIAWATQVLAESPPRYERLTADDVRRYGIGMPTRNMAAGGIADSFDDEHGSDDTGIQPRVVQGGLLSLAQGGALPPRFLSGGGDGMSDSIPARIAGKQEARLADGEFVIPADVVSHLGNGSSKAGAKKLYAMMDRARQARTGKTRQAPAIKAERVMPA